MLCAAPLPNSGTFVVLCWGCLVSHNVCTGPLASPCPLACPHCRAPLVCFCCPYFVSLLLRVGSPARRLAIDYAAQPGHANQVNNNTSRHNVLIVHVQKSQPGNIARSIGDCAARTGARIMIVYLLAHYCVICAGVAARQGADVAGGAGHVPRVQVHTRMALSRCVSRSFA